MRQFFVSSCSWDFGSLSRCINEINGKNSYATELRVITSLFTRLLLCGNAIFSSAAATATFSRLHRRRQLRRSDSACVIKRSVLVEILN